MTFWDFVGLVLKGFTKKKFQDGSNVIEAKKNSENFTYDGKKRFVFRTCRRLQDQKNTSLPP